MAEQTPEEVAHAAEKAAIDAMFDTPMKLPLRYEIKRVMGHDGEPHFILRFRTSAFNVVTVLDRNDVVQLASDLKRATRQGPEIVKPRLIVPGEA